MAANKGYFQILPNSPGDYKVAGNVTVAGGAGLATFAALQTSVYMGLGSRVEYNGGGSVGYVAGKFDQRSWYLVDANGVFMPNLGATPVVSVTADFSSLGLAEAGFAALTGNANITAAGANQDVHFVCYANQTTFDVDATQCVFSGPTCDDTHEFFIYSITNLATQGNFVHANVNNGTWGGTKYRMQATINNSRINLADANILSVHVNHLQIYHSWAGGRPFEMFAPADSNLIVEQCILRIRDTGGPSTGAMIYAGVNDGQRITMRNNICFVSSYVVGGGSYLYGFFTIRDGRYLLLGNTFWNFDDIANDAGMFLINNFLDFRNLAPAAQDYHDFNVYRGSDLDEAHGKLTTQTAEELFLSGTGTEDTFVWYPTEESDLIGAGIKLRDEDTADLDHELNYRLNLETHPIDNYTDGDTWLPTDFLSPRARWDVGPLGYYPQNVVMYGICPNSGGDFKVASQIAILDGIMHCVNNQNHALMGIGARVIYDGATVATVVGKLAENEWMVLTLTGAKPTDTNNVVLNSIQQPFGSQSTFEAGFSGNLGTSDLTAAEVSMHGICYCEQGGFTVDNTAVHYNGTTCDEQYQLWIYTPWDTVRQSNFNHRVQAGGVWDITRYRLELAASVLQTGNGGLQFIHINGIQFHMSSAAAAAITAIYILGMPASKIWFDQCVMRIADVGANWLRTAVRVDTGNCETLNCVAFLIGLNAIQVDFTGMIADGADSFLDVIHCTIYGWRTPLSGSAGGTITAYNNAIIGNSLISNNLTTQDYNVYDINEGETHGFLTAQADNALFAAVAGGRETWDWTPLLASDLINRAQHFNLYTNDLDNQPGQRYQSIAPDAGVLERAQAVTPFGVCPNCPGNFETGAGNITIVDGVGTFEVPQINVLMGVGARLTYDGGTIAYVKEMINPFQFILVTATGTAAPNDAGVSVDTITHPFASQSAAEAGYAPLTGNASLIAGDYQLWIPCYAEQATYAVDAVAAEYDGPTCDFGHWIKVFQTFSTIKESIFQHRVTDKGDWDETKYRHEMAGNPSMDIHDTAAVISYILFSGLQIHNSTVAAGNRTAIAVRGTNGSVCLIEGCNVRFSDGSDPRICIGLITTGVSAVTVMHSLMYQPETNHANSRGILVQVKDWLDCYHTGFYNCSRAIEALAGATVNVLNNWFLANATGNSGVDVSDFNLYREVDEGDVNGMLSIQSNQQLFQDYDVGGPIHSTWSPAPGSDLENTGMQSRTIVIDFAFMLNGDLDHPFETEWRPEGGFYDIGPLEKGPSGFIPQWYTYW